MNQKLNVSERPFVVYWNNIPAPYMVERFNALADQDPFEFEAWFNDRIEPDRSWRVDERQWKFRYRYMPTVSIFSKNFRLPTPLFRRRPDLIVCLHAEPVFIVGWVIAKLRRIKVGFRVLKTFDQWVDRKWYKEAIKRFLFRRVDVIETTGPDGQEYAERYGACTHRIHHATHTVNVELLMPRLRTARVRRDQLRSELGIRGTTYVYVGRLWKEKGIFHLLSAFESAQSQVPIEISLLLVGDGPDEVSLRRHCADRAVQNVVFAGFQHQPELTDYLAAADVFVFPTLGDPYGVVVDEAMVCGMPIISTACAGDIRSRVAEGVNGFIVPPGDSAVLAEKIMELSGQDERIKSMGSASAEMARDHTPENWARQFASIVRQTLNVG